MNAPQVRGITGLLNGLLSPEPNCGTSLPKTDRPRPIVPRPDASAATSPKPATAARRGRPLGRSTASTAKDKLTVRISVSLIAAYRDWSWEARSQLSHLVERALTDYHEQRGPGSFKK